MPPVIPRWMIPLLVLAMVSGPVVTVTPAASASACGGTALHGQLYGVAATSATDAWAVGNYRGNPGARTLVEHWNGTEWCQVPSPNPAPADEPDGLSAVAATSATDAWAVGDYYSPSAGTRTLILHWNGTTWTQIPSPDPSPVKENFLNAVTATSATDAWAAGISVTSAGRRTLMLHWNGTTWTRVPSPTPGMYVTLAGVAASSTSQAWVAGVYNSPYQTLTLRWNGTAWKYVRSPDPATGNGARNSLTGVAATSASNAWAVGWDATSSSLGKTLVLHWSGATWDKVAAPAPGRGSGLTGVAATSASSAWAVGSYGNGAVSHTLVLQWNGTAWTRATSPSPGGPSGYDELEAVAASSATDAWAVGYYDSGQTEGTLILHWNGTTWTDVPSP
jgi:hypothetical protein